MIKQIYSAFLKPIFKYMIDHPLFQFWGITVICAYYYLVSQSVTLDDAFIYFRLVNNLIKTGKPIFNIGDNYFIATSPLWTGLLASGKIVCPFFNLELIAKFGWVILLVIASLLGYLAFYPSIGKWAVFTSCPFFLSPLINSMTGNEIALLYLAIFGVLWASVFQKPLFIGFFLGIGYLARGEFIFMIIPVFFHVMINRKKQHILLKHTILTLTKISVMMLAIILLWHCYYLLTFHSFFPKTFEVKMLQGQSGQWIIFHQAIWGYLMELLVNRTYLLFFVLIGALWQPHVFGFMAIYTLCHSIAYCLLKIPYYHWYYYDYYIFVLMLVLFGIFRIIDMGNKLITQTIKLTEWEKRGYRPRLLCMVMIIWLFPIRLQSFLPKHIANIYQNNNLDSRGNSYTEISKRLLKELQPNDIILTDEVGIFSYYLENYEIRDVNGLASPDINLFNMYNWAYFVDLYQPRFLILSDHEELKYFEFNRRLYLYQQHFTIPQSVTHRGVTVYIQSLSPEIEILQTIKSNSQYSPDVHYFIMNNEIALFCQPPFESSVQVSQNASKFEMQIGFVSLLHVFEKASTMSNGVKLTLSVIKGNSKIAQLATYTIFPFKEKQMSLPIDISINLPADARSIKIILDPIDNNGSYDWVYISKIKFN